MSRSDPIEYLRRLGKAGDGPHDIAVAALMLAALDHRGCDLEPYRAHLAEIAEQARLLAGPAASAMEGAHALSSLLGGRYGYESDRIAHDDPRNADFIAVIERRRGISVALGILYLHAARAAGLDASGLGSPGHFLLRIGLGDSAAFIDPLIGGAALDREFLRAPPTMRGMPGDEPQILEAVADTEILLRLANTQKLHALQAGAGGRALNIAQRMSVIAPARPEIWMDLARLSEAEGALGAARNAYEACLALAQSGAPLHNEAALGLHGLKRRLN